MKTKNYLFPFIVIFFSCFHHKETIPVEVGFSNTELFLGDHYKAVREKLQEDLLIDVNGINNESKDLVDYFIINNPIEVRDHQLNSITYLTFKDSSLVSFSISYTIDNNLYNRKLLPEIIKELTSDKLKGAREVIESSENIVINTTEGYNKSFEIDSSQTSYDNLRYSIKSILD